MAYSKFNEGCPFDYIMPWLMRLGTVKVCVGKEVILNQVQLLNYPLMRTTEDCHESCFLKVGLTPKDSGMVSCAPSLHSQPCFGDIKDTQRTILILNGGKPVPLLSL